MISRKQVRSWLDLHPEYKDRKMMYQAVVEYLRPLELSPAEYVQYAIHCHRRLQECVPNNQKGLQLQADYMANEGFISKENARVGQININGQWFKVV